MNTLLFSLVAIAALDSLNPTAITLQIYLLSTPKSIARSISFILGVFLTYWITGFLAILGLRTLVISMISNANVSFPEPYIYISQMLIGLALLIAGFSFKSSDQAASTKRPKNLTLGRTFLLGMAVTIFDFPTALPYFAAIEQIAELSWTCSASWVFWRCTTLSLYFLK